MTPGTPVAYLGDIEKNRGHQYKVHGVSIKGDEFYNIVAVAPDVLTHDNAVLNVHISSLCEQEVAPELA